MILATFQKGSPYISDANDLIRAAIPTGLLDINTAMQNSTKCDTWHDIVDSHASEGFAPLTVLDLVEMVCMGSTLLMAASACFALEKMLRYLTRAASRLFRVEPCRHCEPSKHQRHTNHTFVLCNAKY